MYVDAQSNLAINGVTSDAFFEISRSMRQGCPLAPYLYLFIADCLGNLLNGNQNLEGLRLPGGAPLLD